MGRTALVFSTDEAFAPLAKGLVLSILSHDLARARFALNLIDIGCSDATRAWMVERDVRVTTFAPAEFLSRRQPRKLKPYQAAQLCRPFIPRLFPGFEAYIWCDSDIWIQNPESLFLIERLASQTPHKLVISPVMDISYKFIYQDCGELMRYNRTWFRDAYGETVASTYSSRAVLSSGVFGLHASSEIWSLWEQEINNVISRNYTKHSSFHLAEQTALNYLAYSTGDFIPIPATHNYNCHVGAAKRDPSGRVVIDIPPYDEIGVVHLTFTGKMIPKYIAEGLLYDQGKYLTATEVEQLKRIAHY